MMDPDDVTAVAREFQKRVAEGKRVWHEHCKNPKGPLTSGWPFTWLPPHAVVVYRRELGVLLKKRGVASDPP